MSDDRRPDPDELLRAVRQAETRSGESRLRVFFGMAAGVGKTYAMLKSAQEARSNGADVVIGVVETHGRPETAALAEGIPMIPRRRLDYRGTSFEELDIDGVLQRRPGIVLVDELAHTNVPGSRHSKRWQDVCELLDAGIDVYTTLNVQHLESRKETVESVTGVAVSETVPDTILERASQVVLIDITPVQLLQRLREGKVYLGERASVALEHFFKEDRLTALREIALRFTAERVDNDLRTLRVEGDDQSTWRPSERLMVAISHSPYSEHLIRATRRVAYSLEAPWIAVNVDVGQNLNVEDRATLSRNIALVRDLGGELVATSDTDVVDALERIARQRQVTQLIVGRPTRRLLRDLVTGGTLLDRLARRAGGFDIHVLRLEGDRRRPPLRVRLGGQESAWPGYLGAMTAVGATALLNAALVGLIGYRAVGFVFLFAMLGFSLFASLGPVFLAAGLSALVWNYFFIPPVGTFAISDISDVFMCAAYFIVASATGFLTHMIRHRERMLRLRERHTGTLYEIVRVIAQTRDHVQYLPTVARHLGLAINCDCAIAPVSDTGKRIGRWYPAPFWGNEDVERAVAGWVLDHGVSAGWSTDTIPSAQAMYAPLMGNSGIVGIIACRSKGGARLVPEEQALLGAVAHQLSVALDRELLEARAANTQRLQDSERLHQTLLNSVSHEIRTPLTAILGSASALQARAAGNDSSAFAQLVPPIVENAQRLNRVVDNLLDMSRLDSGTLTLRRDWHDPADVIGIAVESVQQVLSRHTVDLVLPDSLPLVRIDVQLFQHALMNLLVNAAAYAPPDTRIEIGAKASRDNLELWVSDEGPGIPPDRIPKVFDKFCRVPSSSAGAGLGLSIAKGIVEAHGGSIAVANNAAKGCRFTIRLPLERQPELPVEDTR